MPVSISCKVLVAGLLLYPLVIEKVFDCLGGNVKGVGDLLANVFP
ncbi:MAG TPA: hypothetical protein VHC96_23215 [Puia sp.]|nr:hypothetical protein [Puia sp.]